MPAPQTTKTAPPQEGDERSRIAPQDSVQDPMQAPQEQLESDGPQREQESGGPQSSFTEAIAQAMEEDKTRPKE